MKRTCLVLGLGNPILSDDGVGIAIARRLQELHVPADVLEASAGGFRVVDEILGYRRLVLVDAVKTGLVPPGSLLRFSFEEFDRALHGTSPHDISLFQAFEVMRRAGEELPQEIAVYGVEIADCSTFSESLTPAVQAAVDDVAQTILREQFRG